MNTAVKTADQVKKQFQEAGISVSAWARTHGFSRDVVNAVLRGRSRGLRGEAHRAAVALGLKHGQVVEVRSFLPAAERVSP